MAEQKSKSQGSEKGGQFRLHLAGQKPNEERPNIVVTAVSREGKPLHVAPVDEQGNFDMPADVLKEARLILVGPATEDQEAVDPDTFLRYRPRQFEQLIREGTLTIPSSVWKKWFLFIHCVTGTVKLCRRRPWWFAELGALATAPQLELKQSISAPKFSLRAETTGQISAATSISDLINFPFRCQVICNGTVEVYRRTCCCQPWIIEDPRLPELIRELEEIARQIPVVVPIPQPNPPDPAPFVEAQFFKEGALDERALNAHTDLAALRSLSKSEAIEYINARPHLICRHHSCGTPKKVGQGFINPDGRFNICWFDGPHIHLRFCHDEYAYIVRQQIGIFNFVVYNGVAANIWFNEGDDATLVSYSPFAYGCRDNGEPGSGAYVFLDVIGDTESWNLKTPNATGWDRVASPAYNDGLVFPASSPAAALGVNLNRNWGGTLKLNYKFSEDMRVAPVGAMYYRISITEADSSGNPTGTRFYLTDGLSWDKSVPDGMGGVDIVSVGLGPNTVGGQDNLFLIPYNHDADWNADQYHGFLNTTDTRWADGTKRHLITLEVFDSTGKLLHPNGTTPTGQTGLTEGTAPFTFRRRFQDLGPTADVPFAALTHMFWWDNSPLDAEILDLRKDGLLFNEECLFLQGTAASTFGIGYRAYHPNEMFQLYHSITWQRGLGLSADAYGTLLSADPFNVGQPPAPEGTSPTNTFQQMLRPDLDATRKKCAFTVFLSISSKTTDGDYLGNGGITRTGAFAIEIN